MTVSTFEFPKESKQYPGFFHPFGPAGEDVVVSRDGRVIDLHTGQFLKIHQYDDKRGRVVSLVKRNTQYGLKKLLALTFVPIPENMRSRKLQYLRSAHANGDNTDYRVENIIWHDPSVADNFRTSRPIKTRNIRTGEVNHYQSATECAAALKVTVNEISLVVTNSKKEGVRTIKWNVLMINDGRAWPSDDKVIKSENSAYFPNRIIKITDTQSQKVRWVCTSEYAARIVGCTSPHIRRFLTNESYKSYIVMGRFCVEAVDLTDVTSPELIEGRHYVRSEIDLNEEAKPCW